MFPYYNPLVNYAFYMLYELEYFGYNVYSFVTFSIANIQSFIKRYNPQDKWMEFTHTGIIYYNIN